LALSFILVLATHCLRYEAEGEIVYSRAYGDSGTARNCWASEPERHKRRTQNSACNRNIRGPGVRLRRRIRIRKPACWQGYYWTPAWRLSTAGRRGGRPSYDGGRRITPGYPPLATPSIDRLGRGGQDVRHTIPATATKSPPPPSGEIYPCYRKHPRCSRNPWGVGKDSRPEKRLPPPGLTSGSRGSSPGAGEAGTVGSKKRGRR